MQFSWTSWRVPWWGGLKLLTDSPSWSSSQQAKAKLAKWTTFWVDHPAQLSWGSWHASSSSSYPQSPFSKLQINEKTNDHYCSKQLCFRVSDNWKCTWSLLMARGHESFWRTQETSEDIVSISRLTTHGLLVNYPSLHFLMNYHYTTTTGLSCELSDTKHVPVLPYIWAYCNINVNF